MFEQDIKNSFEKSALRMSGSVETFGSKLTGEDSNDPATHKDLHDRIKVDYEKMDKMPDMKEVHKLQREHIKKGDPSKEGYPLI